MERNYSVNLTARSHNCFGQIQCSILEDKHPICLLGVYKRSLIQVRQKQISVLNAFISPSLEGNKYRKTNSLQGMNGYLRG